MKIQRLCLALACILALCACAPQPIPQSTSLKPPASTASQSASVPQEEVPVLPPLAVETAEDLPNEPQSWWFGSERNENNVPVQCAAMQALNGSLGLVTQGPDPGAVYLTFDLGYETGYTAQILDALQSRGATATFFLTLNYPQQNPELVARMLAEGHSVGGHSATHPGAPAGLCGLEAEERQAEITAVAQHLQQGYGYESQLFRFPEGIYSEAALAEAALLGQYSVFWSYAYRDYDPDDQPDETDSLQKAMDAAHPGAIYLLHLQRTNAEILPDLLDELAVAGYQARGL